MRSTLIKYLYVFRLLKPDPISISILVVLSALLSVLTYFEPVMFGRVIDLSLRQAWRGGGHILQTILLWASVALGSIVSQYIVFNMATSYVQESRFYLIRRFLSHVMRLSAKFHSENGATKLNNIVQQNSEQLSDIWLNLFKGQLPSIFLYCIIIPFSMSMNSTLASVMLVTSLGFSVGGLFLLRSTESAAKESNKKNSEVSHLTSDILHNISLIQIFDRSQRELVAIERSMSDILIERKKLINLWSFGQVIARAASSITMIAVVAAGSILLGAHETTFGEIAGFIGLSYLMVYSLQGTTNFIIHNMTRVNSLDDFIAIFDEVETVAEIEDPIELKNVRGDIVFDNVSFSYDERRPTISNVNCVISAGSFVAIVGGSGSGKSTFVGLLQRLWDPQVGSITIDGIDIRNVSLSSLRQNISAMPQDNALLCRTIRENICIGASDVSIDDLEHLCGEIGADGFISHQLQGYDTIVGERGRYLSGGQRQRIGIARSLVKAAPIFVFDEATSALDGLSEAQIQDVLNRFRGNRTTLFVSHRLSMLEHADLILVLENGRLVEYGSYAALRGGGGYLSRLLGAGAKAG